MAQSAPVTTLSPSTLISYYDDFVYETAWADPMVALMGARKMGRSSLFRGLAAEQPHMDGRDRCIQWVYIDLLDARMSTQEGFWSVLGEAAGFSEQFSQFRDGVILDKDLADVLKAISTAVRTRVADDSGERGNHRLVITLDNWADSKHGAGGRPAHIESLRALTAAMHTHKSETAQENGLGLFIVTHFPNIDLLKQWATAESANFPGLKRLSGEIERYSHTVFFPRLTAKQSRRAAIQYGCPGPIVDQVVQFCGGWLDLIRVTVQEVAQAAATSGFDPYTNGAALPYAVREAVSSHAFRLLRDPLLREYSAKAATPRLLALTGVDRDRAALDLLAISAKTTSRVARAHCLFLDYRSTTEPHLLAPAIRANLNTPHYLVVDSENLVLHFTKEGGIEREEHQKREVYTALGAMNLEVAIEAAAHAVGVPPENIVITTRSRARLQEILGLEARGAVLNPEWNVVHTFLSEQEQRGKRPGRSSLSTDEQAARASSDDTAAAVEVTRLATEYPNGRFYLLTGDKDYPGNLGRLDRGQYTLLAAWRKNATPSTVRVAARAGWDIRENGLPNPHKPGSLFPATLAELLRSANRRIKSGAVDGVNDTVGFWHPDLMANRSGNVGSGAAVASPDSLDYLARLVNQGRSQ